MHSCTGAKSELVWPCSLVENWRPGGSNNVRLGDVSPVAMPRMPPLVWESQTRRSMQRSLQCHARSQLAPADWPPSQAVPRHRHGPILSSAQHACRTARAHFWLRATAVDVRRTGIGDWKCSTSGGMGARSCFGRLAGSVKAARVASSPSASSAARESSHRVLSATRGSEIASASRSVAGRGEPRWRAHLPEARARALVRFALESHRVHRHPVRPAACGACGV